MNRYQILTVNCLDRDVLFFQSHQNKMFSKMNKTEIIQF